MGSHDSDDTGLSWIQCAISQNTKNNVFGGEDADEIGGIVV